MTLPDGWPGEKLALRFFDIVERLGVGILSPAQAKRLGKAHAEVRRIERLMDAQTARDVEDVLSGRKVFENGKLLQAPKKGLEEAVEPYLLTPHSTGDFIEFSRNQQTRDTARKLLNVRAAVMAAEEEILGDTAQTASDAAVSDDWLARWKDGAAEVSDEEMRNLWAKALAGEIQSPGKYSFRTLSLLKNLGPKEAERIALVGSYVLDSVIVKADCHVDGLRFENFLEMEELGILTGVQGMLANTYTLIDQNDGRFAAMLSCLGGGRGLFVETKGPLRKFALDAFKLTRVGAEIFSLGIFPVSEKYLEAVANRIHGQQLDVALGDIRDRGSQGFEIYNEKWLRHPSVEKNS